MFLLRISVSLWTFAINEVLCMIKNLQWTSETLSTLFVSVIDLIYKLSCEFYHIYSNLSDLTLDLNHSSDLPDIIKCYQYLQCFANTRNLYSSMYFHDRFSDKKFKKSIKWWFI